MNITEITKQTRAIQEELRKHPFFVLNYFTASDPEAVKIHDQLKTSWKHSQLVLGLAQQIFKETNDKN